MQGTINPVSKSAPYNLFGELIVFWEVKVNLSQNLEQLQSLDLMEVVLIANV
jgi:hypothetical protein